MLVFEGKRIGVSVETWGDHKIEVVEHPGAVAVVAIDRDFRMAVIKQFRPVVQDYLYELPAGTLEPGERPLDCAIRELKEETGLVANDWEMGPILWSSPGYSREKIHFFFAHNVEQTEAEPEDGEDITLEWIKPDGSDVLRILDPEAMCAKTLIGIELWADYLQDLP